MLGTDPDVVVCGAGAAGMAAALSAARAGARVWLCDEKAEHGGTYVHALLHTLAGLYDGSGEPLNGGLAEELEARLMRDAPHVRRRRMGKVWVLSVEPKHYQHVTRAWLREEERLTYLERTKVVAVERDGSHIRRLTLSRDGVLCQVSPRAVVDASGEGAVARLCGPEWLLPESDHAAAGLVLRLSGVDRDALVFPRNLAVTRTLQAAVERGDLPPSCARAFVDVGILPGEAFLKLFVPAQAIGSDEVSLPSYPESTIGQIVACLRSLEGFSEVRVAELGRVTERDAGRVRGTYVLTAEDVRALRSFEDAACRCAWPIEHWSGERGVTLEYLPAQGAYEIPLRALRFHAIENAFVAGKCLSAEPLAQASARCVGTCWSMGEAVGRAAARSTAI